jgi:hypothetical protein
MVKLIAVGLLCASCSSLVGCAAVSSAITGDLPTVTAGITGCAPESVVIENYKGGFSADTWTAKCGGKTFYCSKGHDAGSCKEAIKN